MQKAKERIDYYNKKRDELDSLTTKAKKLYASGYSIAEISREIGIPESSVRALI